jgi:flagellar FliJ protein
MNREQRIGTYRRSLESNEKKAAARLSEAEKKLQEARQRLEQLERYRSDYTASFGTRAAAGISGPALLDFQAFIARLEEAIRQQASVVTKIEMDRGQVHQRLREVAVQNRAVGAVVERWRAEDRVAENRIEQKAVDERSGRAAAVMTLTGT